MAVQCNRVSSLVKESHGLESWIPLNHSAQVDQLFYKGETVRLLRALPEFDLKKDVKGYIVSIRRGDAGEPLAAELQIFTGGREVMAEVPLNAIELVISTGGCTAVLWQLEKTAPTLIEKAVHSLLDYGFEMRAGVNIMQLTYNRSLGVWETGEWLSDPTGAQAVVAGSTWDGFAVAFSGPQRYMLEFRVRGRRPPYVMLHQRWEIYQEQRRTSHPAMTLLRLLLHLASAVEAEFCAVPVAGNWLVDEDWGSLLVQPYYPDLFIIPQYRLPDPLPPLYRAQPLVNGKAILTTLPVKFSPTDDPIERTERELRLNQLRACQAIGEKAYDQMYEAHGSLSGLYSDAKEAFYDAISIANELGLKEESEALQKRLEHIKAVFRSQFS